MVLPFSYTQSNDEEIEFLFIGNPLRVYINILVPKAEESLLPTIQFKALTSKLRVGGLNVKRDQQL